MKDKCYFCKEEKEIGKDLFWCPRLREYNDNDILYYGSWVCLKCCEDEFYKAIHDMYLKTSWCGSCAECDFPVGAILNAKEFYGKPEDMEVHVVKQKDHYFFYPELFSSYNCYYSYNWDEHQNRLKLVKRMITEGVSSLVLKHNKLPVRKVILLEDTFTYDPLLWRDLARYYWSSYGCQQHFREEAWMDVSPVIICSGYLDKNGLNLDNKFKKIIEYLKQKFGMECEK